MSTSRYFVEAFFISAGDFTPAWHATDHGTLQAAVLSARYLAQRLGEKNVALFDRSPTRVEF